MNRPIKFRAWDKKHNRFVYFSLSHGETPEVRQGHGHTDCEFEPWQQFTGLTDKNGKEIYEGDLLEVKDIVDRPYIVHAIWDEYNACWHRSRDYRFGEIIGNICENPELLTK